MINSLQIKLCGFSEVDSIDFASQFSIDFIGFVFYPKSPRNVNISDLAQITKNIPKNIKKVAVLVDASDAQIAKIIQELKPNFLQLHGDETLERLQEIKKLFNIPIIKAFRIASKKDLEEVGSFENIADYFLFDAKTNDEKGGSGKNFDWNILKDLKTQKPWFLSGGINGDNLPEAIKISGAKMIDLSSALEEVKGIKSKRMIKQFIQKLEDLNSQ